MEVYIYQSIKVNKWQVLLKSKQYINSGHNPFNVMIRRAVYKQLTDQTSM